MFGRKFSQAPKPQNPIQFSVKLQMLKQITPLIRQDYHQQPTSYKLKSPTKTRAISLQHSSVTTPRKKKQTITGNSTLQREQEQSLKSDNSQPELGASPESMHASQESLSCPSIDEDEFNEKTCYYTPRTKQVTPFKAQVKKEKDTSIVQEVPEPEESRNSFSFQPRHVKQRSLSQSNPDLKKQSSDFTFAKQQSIRNSNMPVVKEAPSQGNWSKVSSRKISQLKLFDRLFNNQGKAKPTTAECYERQDKKQVRQHCTFRPNLAKGSPQSRHILPQTPKTTIRTQKKTTENLYKTGKKRDQILKLQRDLYASQELLPCTFQPKINPPLLSAPTSPSTQQHLNKNGSKADALASTRSRCWSVSSAGSSPGKQQSDKRYKKMVTHRINQMVDSLDAHQISKGLTEQAFSHVLQKFGYGTSTEHASLVSNLFHGITGIVKDIHRSACYKHSLKSVQMPQLKALVMAIHGINDATILKGQYVWPEALNNNQQIGKLAYKLRWKLDTSKDLMKYTQALLPLKLSWQKSKLQQKSEYTHAVAMNKSRHESADKFRRQQETISLYRKVLNVQILRDEQDLIRSPVVSLQNQKLYALSKQEQLALLEEESQSSFDRYNVDEDQDQVTDLVDHAVALNSATSPRPSFLALSCHQLQLAVSFKEKVETDLSSDSCENEVPERLSHFGCEPSIKLDTVMQTLRQNETEMNQILLSAITPRYEEGKQWIQSDDEEEDDEQDAEVPDDDLDNGPALSLRTHKFRTVLINEPSLFKSISATSNKQLSSAQATQRSQAELTQLTIVQNYSGNIKKH